MKIGIVRVGPVDSGVISRIQESLDTIFADTKTALIADTLPMPEEAYAKTRQQYRSDIILAAIRNFAEIAQFLRSYPGNRGRRPFCSQTQFRLRRGGIPWKGSRSIAVETQTRVLRKSRRTIRFLLKEARKKQFMSLDTPWD